MVCVIKIQNMTRYKWLGLLYFNRSNFTLKWLKIGSKWVKNYFSHFSQFLARNGSFFLASREKSKTREMCTSTLFWFDEYYKDSKQKVFHVNFLKQDVLTYCKWLTNYKIQKLATLTSIYVTFLWMSIIS